MTTDGLCERCSYRVRRDLADLPQLWQLLSTTPGRRAGQRVSGRREPPAGVRMDVLSFIGPAMSDTVPTNRLDIGAPDLQVGPLPLRDTLAQWVRVVADQRHLRIAGRVDPVAFLLLHHPWSARQPWADDYGEEIRAAAAVARTLAGAGHLTHKLDLPCPYCGVAALVRDNGCDDVVCHCCGHQWTREDYDRLVATTAEQIQAEQLTAEQVREAAS